MRHTKALADRYTQKISQVGKREGRGKLRSEKKGMVQLARKKTGILMDIIRYPVEVVLESVFNWLEEENISV